MRLLGQSNKLVFPVSIILLLFYILATFYFAAIMYKPTFAPA
jgi:hypothetical protein